MVNGLAIRIKGKVQGVGFRPFVWQLARQLQLSGEVLNDGEGVLVRIAEPEQLERFSQQLHAQLPPLARIDSISASAYQWPQAPDGFAIVQSQATAMDTQVVPDAATCPECLRELMDSQDRRYHYPFINCTHCGPRFTIINQLPYDRPKTVMAAFPLCAQCQSEYADPADRRYHAQPVACPECGPQVTLTDNQGNPLAGDWLQAVINGLSKGQIVAIKSVGGFHLACDANNPQAIDKLRQRKQRRFKPFAVMLPELAAVQQLAYCNQAEQQVLQSSAAPIVLLKAKADSRLAAQIAPNLNEIGVMLPSNPVQYLIAESFQKPMVMTSGNRSGLPPALDNQHALDELADIADLFVLHDRDIVQRSDDSLLRLDASGQQETLRRSRGYVPDAIDLPAGFPCADGYIAYGGDLKNAFAIGKGKQLIISHYLGDLANIETQQQYHQAIEHYRSLYQLEFSQHVADMHPGYYSHQLAKRQSGQLIQVQHHHAHVAACLLENGRAADSTKVLALALDGLGMGDDGSLWGGELMLADYSEYQLIGGLPAITLAGGDAAARQPWMSLFAHLQQFAPELIAAEQLATLFVGKPTGLLGKAMKSGVGCHQVRSAGRLFDAVAASLGIATEGIEYEGQAACELEALANRYAEGLNDSALSQQLNADNQLICLLDDAGKLSLDLSGFWQSWFRLAGSPAEKAYLFHHSLANALSMMVIKASERLAVDDLVLTGGVFHNSTLTRLLKQALPDSITVLQHRTLSCGDGGLALGQLAVALSRKANSK